MQSDNTACTFVRILSTSVSAVTRPWKQHPCFLLVWNHKSPFLIVKKCTCIKGKPPTGRQCLQEPREGSLGGFAICCPSCPFEHLHLLLASPCAAAGISHSVTGTYSDTILFSLPSCLSACDLAQLCFFQHPPLKHRLHAKVSMHLCLAPLLCCCPTVLQFLAPLVIH